MRIIKKNTKNSIIEIIFTFVIFILLDSLYLSLMRDYFDNQIQIIQGTKIYLKIYPAIICYIALVFGLYYFIISKNNSILDAFLLGIVIYSVYETTNLALINKWTIKTAIIDTLWGGILFSLTTFLIYYFIQKV